MHGRHGAPVRAEVLKDMPTFDPVWRAEVPAAQAGSLPTSLALPPAAQSGDGLRGVGGGQVTRCRGAGMWGVRSRRPLGGR